MNLPFKQVDVFTSSHFKGNPVAVVNCLGIDSKEISTEQMLSIANWTNLSETTFLFKPTVSGCDYKLRIFCPTSELPFAGHPTIGSCKAFMEFTGKKDATQLKQECGVGIVNLNINDGVISFKAEKAELDPIAPEVIEAYSKVLNLKPTENPLLLHVGPEWVVFHVKDAETCYNANPNYAALKEVSSANNHIGIILAGPKSDSAPIEYEMRAFAPSINVDEDPVCGSGSIALIRYLQNKHNFEKKTKISISQGGRIGRNGQISSVIDILPDGKVEYNSGGKALCIIDGSININ